jgi:hypothetical protein
VTNLVRHRYISWIAIFAVLVVAFGPTLSRALPSSSNLPPAWADICSSTSGDYKASAPGAPSRNHDAGHSHCPLCLGHSIQFALMAAPYEFHLAAGKAAGYFSPAANSTLSRFIRHRAQPRAPPAYS